MNANVDLIFDIDQWILENTREPKAPFRAGTLLHRLNIQNGHFYKEIGSCVTYQGRYLEEGSLVHILYDMETLTRKVGLAVYLPDERLVIGEDGVIAFNLDNLYKRLVIACPGKESLKLAETGYTVICASQEVLHLTLPEELAILDAADLFEGLPVEEMTPQKMRIIIDHAYESEERANIQKQAELMAATNTPVPTVFDKLTPFPEVSGSGKPIATIENLEELLHRMGAVTRYNVIKKDLEVLIPGKAYSRDNQANASIAEVISHCHRVGMPSGNVDQYLTEIGDRNQYNPVMTWIESKPWDGIKRWDEFCKTITPMNVRLLSNGTALHTALIKRWMTSAVAAASSPNGIAAQGVLVLQGEQNLGKTNWFKSLAPSDMDILQDGLTLKPDDKDSVKNVVSYWLVELGELDATFKKSDIAALKAFLTRDYDVLRRPYARGESHYARRTVFFGSVNPKDFLQDPTGNRRYWTIECASVDYEHTFDMQQVWAEIYEWLKQGPKNEENKLPWLLTTEEFNALNESNEEFHAVDPIEERILSKLDWNTPQSTWRWVTATEVLMEIGIDRPTRGDVTKAGTTIRKHNGKQCKRTNGKNLMLAPKPISFMSDNQYRPF
ncbi:virulence-associated E family protein [Acinetobacter schindleri]|uniref:VapE domain-containing protein n=1 Tax=Acinetobacter schindleri TaxID=108981 RepID=UPI0013B0A9CA|nr:VapE domain-containing protein [Acinetobacter schindleri]QIC60176.1 virulence-associated E family protein [Acinetobacter schindleri]